MKRYHLLLSILLILVLTLLALLVLKFEPDESFASVTPPASLKYVALGDSVTYGIGAPSGLGFANQYSNYINNDLNSSVSLNNLGVPTWFSSQLLNDLKTKQNYRDAVSSANVITIFIGLNDYQAGHYWYLDPNATICLPKETCMQQILDGFRANWDQIVTEIKSLNPRNDTSIRALTIYNPYVTEDQAVGNFTYFKNYLDQMNSHILSTAAANGVLVADINQIFNGSNGDQDATTAGFFTAPDELHPNLQGHVTIANYLRGLGYFELDQDSDSDADLTDNCPGISNPDQANFNKESIDLPAQYTFGDVTNPIGDELGDACDPDIDHDGLANSEEIMTSATSPDSDNDNFLDGAEIHCGSNPTVANSTPKKPYPSMPSYTALDSDNDGLPNTCESYFGANQTVRDSDADGFNDGFEVLYKGTNPSSIDSDNDGCSDLVESASTNADKVVNSADQLMIAQTFNKRVGQLGYSKSFDVNGDGVINSGDQLLIASVFNQRCN